MTEAITSPDVEGSFEARWEKFVEDNNLASDIAAKLKPVFYSGAATVFDELQNAVPVNNTSVAVGKAVASFGALQEEVYGFFSEADIDSDLDVGLLVIKEKESD